MNRAGSFSLENHPGPYEKWPGSSRLLLGGKSIGLDLPGYALRFQTQLTFGHLFVSDYDCPYEELTSFLLVSSDFRIVSRRFLLGVLFRSMERTDDRQWVIEFHESPRYKLTLRSWGIPYLYPRLGLTQLRGG